MRFFDTTDLRRAKRHIVIDTVQCCIMLLCMLIRTSHIGIWLTIAVFTTVQAAAQPVSTDDMQIGTLAWFEQEWDRANEYPLARNIVVSYSVEMPTEIDAQGLSQLRRDVEGKPDHPDRIRLLIEERRHANGSDINHCEVWSQGTGRWRYNTNHPYLSEGSYFDAASTEKVIWGLANQQLTILDPDETPPPGRDFGSLESQFRWHLAAMLHGLVGSGGRADSMHPTESSIDGDRWTAQAQKEDGTFAVKYRGRYIASEQRIEIDDRTVVHASNESFIGNRAVFSEWLFDDVLKRHVARKVAYLEPSGRPSRIFTFHDARTTTDAEFRKVTGLPQLSKPDPIRGQITVPSIVDLRPRHEQITYVAENGVTTVEPLPASLRSGPPRSLRVVGWVLAGSLIVLFLVLRLKRMS